MALGGGDIGEGIWKGALSGLAGGVVGSYIGGGVGAFAGGATAGGVGTALYGGNMNDIVKGALFGGTVAWGSYEIYQQGFAYRNYKKAGGTFTPKQYNKVSVASQRSFARGKEFGGWLLDDGDVQMWKRGAGGSSIRVNPRPSNAIGEFHTHPNWGGDWIEMQSPEDQYRAIDPSYVIGRQNVWYYDPINSLSPTVELGSARFNVYPYYFNWFGSPLSIK